MIYQPIPDKRCTKCRVYFPGTSEFFYKAGNRLRRHCKGCIAAYGRERYAAAPERKREQARKWQREHPAEAKEKKRRWAEKNPDKIREKSRRWGRNNRKRHNETTRKWRRAHPEASRAAVERRRARRAGAGGAYDDEDVKRQYKAQKGRCYWCNEKVGNTYHVDHVIPLSRGGNNGPENIVIACPSCNCSKHDKLPHEWTDKLL